MKKHRGNYHDLLLVAALLVTLILIGSQLPAYAAASPVGSAMQIPLDAAQTYTLTYNANGGVIPPPAQKGLMTDSTIARLSIHIPFRTDHTFLGWGISPQANVAYYPADSISIVNPSTTLYAVWEYTPNLPVTYFLAYDYNGGIGGPATQLGLLANTTTIIGNSIPIRANYKFLGWAYSPTASGALYQPGDIIVIGNASVDLYALWEPAVEPQKRTLSYNANFGINAPPNQTGYTDKTYATVGSGQPSHANHTFIGWALSPYATEPQYFAGDTIFLSSGNVTLHAVWARGIHTLTGFVSPLAEDDLGLPDFLA
ncbi:MAG: InlB B-repeat-containing protein, partial [Clostridiales bacterium]|nr:InlB B-repeat-containing protein [Clostridiales bacterium]